MRPCCAHGLTIAFCCCTILTERMRTFLPSKAVIVSAIVARVSGAISSDTCAAVACAGVAPFGAESTGDVHEIVYAVP